MRLEEADEMLRIFKSQPLAHHCDAEGVIVQQLLGMGEQTVGCKIMKKRAKAAIPEIRKE